ncbi:hypothetical protein EXU57_12620 [Segetibacter sp. 3557_3]|uniref:hypothetical protein n=1 Tax=Segetibacter sp. 3557_3 TaxID=2547429 RepID=UPI0010591588|nr:hypothetical protein [Segetibacter sp. 3557_3]TDH25544.1 hypothetical protein EXU57_12620 [Segetibacter sp. 3557_3]
MNSIFQKLSLVAGCSMLLFTNCKKDETTGSNDFQPLTTGSTWTYQNTPGGTSVLTMTGRDTVAQGKTYRVLSNSNGVNNYFRKDGNDYYRFGVLQALGNATIEELYLKGDQKVGDTWTTTQNLPYLGQLVPATLTYTIQAKGIEQTVSGKNYKNVVHVKFSAGALAFKIGQGDFYYAGGIGLIKGDLIVTPPGAADIVQSQVLTDYSIK